jgi:hypothetical protein
MQPEYIYNLLSFPQDYMEYNQERLIDEEKWVASPVDWNRRRLLKKHTIDPRSMMGSKYRGSWLDRDELIKIIKEDADPYGLCEAYYDVLLIEKVPIGHVDGFCWPDEGDTEMWFKAEHKNGESFKWVEIPKPECFHGVVSFT